MDSQLVYEINANFTCSLLIDGTDPLVDVIVYVTYYVKPSLKSDHLDFTVVKIKGNPTFVQNQKYKITNIPLAEFLVDETLNIIKN